MHSISTYSRNSIPIAEFRNPRSEFAEGAPPPHSAVVLGATAMSQERNTHERTPAIGLPEELLHYWYDEAAVSESSIVSMPSFAIAENFTFPHHSVYKPVNEVINTAEWFKELKRFLTSIRPSKLVTIAIANYDFLPMLLNWLISAQVVADSPLDNILILSLDEHLYRLLSYKNISTILVTHESVLQDPEKLDILKRIWMTRLAVVRIINHWGFDVQHFDTDAIILKNPQPLFAKFPNSDVVSQRGEFIPHNLVKGPWGFSLCMGAILFRASWRTGTYKPYHSCFCYMGCCITLLRPAAINTSYFVLKHVSVMLEPLPYTF